MKKFVILISLACLFTYCSSSKQLQKNTVLSGSAAGTTSRSVDNRMQANYSLNDTFSGAQYFPIEGRSAYGTRADLAGEWILDSLNGIFVPEASKINNDLLTPKRPAGSEVRRDSTTTIKTSKGVTETTTTVFIDKTGTSSNKITPPQKSIYHMPAKPTISFYGSNETFAGFTGCNKFAGRYTVAGENGINLQSAAASTKMVCIGDYDEDAYLNALKNVNSFKTVNNKLQLLANENVLLVFLKKQ